MRVLLILMITISINIWNVCGHGGLTIPYGWWDSQKRGDSMRYFGSNGCFEDKKISTKDKNNGLMSKCYYLFFNNDVTWNNAPENIEALSRKIQQNVTYRMPRKMFVAAENLNGTGIYEGAATRADFCHSLDLTQASQFKEYVESWECKNPWHQPGLAKIASGCGVAGGNPIELNGQPKAYCGGNCVDKTAPCEAPNRCRAGYPNGKGAEQYSFPNMPWTEWTRGRTAKVVWNLHANHQGGYSYRLCKIPAQGIEGVTEECFQQTPLDFHGKFQKVRSEKVNKWTRVRATQTTVGTWPKGSMWRKNHYFTIKQANGQYRGQIWDSLKVPTNIPVGEYVLSLRWDCEGAGQIWNGCASVRVV